MLRNTPNLCLFSYLVVKRLWSCCSQIWCWYYHNFDVVAVLQINNYGCWRILCDNIVYLLHIVWGLRLQWRWWSKGVLGKWKEKKKKKKYIWRGGDHPSCDGGERRLPLMVNRRRTPQWWKVERLLLSGRWGSILILIPLLFSLFPI